MKTVTFKYKFDENFNPKYANGAVGGVTNQGEIVINFFLERQALPKLQTYEVNPNGKPGKITQTDPEDFDSSIVRFIQNGVVLEYKSAKEIHRWLGEHIQHLEQQLEKKQK